MKSVPDSCSWDFLGLTGTTEKSIVRVSPWNARVAYFDAILSSSKRRERTFRCDTNQITLTRYGFFSN